MSWYIMHGTCGVGDEPNEVSPLSHFGTDMRWEIGYSRRWFTFWARLLDEDPDEDLTPDETAGPVFEVGSGPYECPDLDMLNRELAAMTMSIPPAIASRLRDEQRRHLAGELGEAREDVEWRRRKVRHAAFRWYLEDVHAFVAGRRG